MAMALTGGNRHYRWAEIQPGHWLSTANKVGLSATVERDVADLVAKTPGVIKAVGAILPENSPREVVEPIFDGLLISAKKLAGPG
jgi:serine/threonine-protein kinase HipA